MLNRLSDRGVAGSAHNDRLAARPTTPNAYLGPYPGAHRLLRSLTALLPLLPPACAHYPGGSTLPPRVCGLPCAQSRVSCGRIGDNDLPAVDTATNSP